MVEGGIGQQERLSPQYTVYQMFAICFDGWQMAAGSIFDHETDRFFVGDFSLEDCSATCREADGEFVGSGVGLAVEDFGKGVIRAVGKAGTLGKMT